MRFTRRLLSAHGVVALGLCACGADPASPDGGLPDAGIDAPVHLGAATFEVTHYDFHLDLTTRWATARLALSVKTPGDCVSIGFRPAAAEDVELGGTAARGVVISDGTLSACDGAGLGWEEGQCTTLAASMTVPMETWSRSQVGYSESTDAEGNPFTYLLSWIGGCDRHGPCDTRPNLFATYRFTVDHPVGTEVYCPGVVTPGDTQTTCDFPYAGGPTYSTFALVAGRSWTRNTLRKWGALDVTLHDTPSTSVTDTLDWEAAAGFFQWMEESFGPYPYGDELRFVVGPTYWAGFEHPGNIVLAEGLAGGGLNHTVKHEVAHQWAGDQVTIATERDFVWKESMAEYLSMVYEDEHDPEYAAHTAAGWKKLAKDALFYPVPDEPLELLAYYGEAYGPGPVILFRQLEGWFGRQAILAALRLVLGSPRAIGLDDLRLALEMTTGADLAEYFDVWLHGEGEPAWPRATVTLTEVEGGTQVAVALATADGKARPCRFAVQLKGDAGQFLDVPVDFGLSGVLPEPQVVSPTFAVTIAAVDPYAEALVWKATATKPERPRRPVEPWRAPPLR